VYDFFDHSCEGNPLYIEEMSTYLMDQSRHDLASLGERIHAQQENPDVPPSLTALLASRIDALDAPQKRLLQFAALLGGRFEGRLLSEALGAEAIHSLCEALQRVHLLAPTKRLDEWRLRSTLIRDAVLRGLLAAQKMEIHRVLSKAIELVYADDLEQHLETLVHHCAEGGRLLDAARFANQSGTLLEKQQRLRRARRVYEQGLACIQATKATPETWDFRTQGEAMISCRLGIVLLLLGQRTTALQHLEVALDIASDAGLHWIEHLAHLEIGRAMTEAGDLERAGAHLEQAGIQAKLHGDAAAQLRIHEAKAELAFELGDHTEATAHWLRVIEESGEDIRLSARCHLGLAGQHVKSGDLVQGVPLLETALQLARTAGDRILEGRAFNNLGLLHFWADSKDDALVCFRHALSLRKGIGYRRGVVINHHNIGDVYFHAGEWSRAGVAFSRSAELAKAMRWREGELFNLVYLRYLDCRLENAPLQPLIETTEHCRTEGVLETATTGAWLVGRHLMERGENGQALPYLEQGLEHAKALGLQGMHDMLEATIQKLSEAKPSR
jgi:tetratricopeptide (TPR) repeat protein